MEEAKKDAKDDSWDDQAKRVVCLSDKYIEEEDEDELELEQAKIFISNQKQMIEEAKKSSTICPPTSKEDINRAVLEKTKEAAAEKVRAITNQAEVAYYGKEDSIDTMEDGVELTSILEYGLVITTSKSSIKHNPYASAITNSFLADDKSIASLVTWETMLSK